jgi:hypothetical protein
MNRLVFYVSLFAILILTACNKKEVTIESLLDEMTDKSAMTYFPDPAYTLKQFSSYDRESVSFDEEGWWANADYTQFIREEENNGRREFVMLETEGPGAVVRFWMTFAGEGATESTLRFYIDGNSEPVIEGNALEVLSGGILAPEPLCASVSPETEYERRGHNLYLPIPYAEHCKITIESDAVKKVDGRWRPSIYYNVCYRTYDENTKVQSFSEEVLNAAQSKIEKTANLLLNPERGGKREIDQSVKLEPQGHINLDLPEGEKAISKLVLKVDAENINQALRSTVLSITFDETETVWVPAGDFFGTGYQLHPSETWYTKVSEDGTMESLWMMPYKESASVQVHNFGEQQVSVDLGVSVDDYNWKNNSMHFGAAWGEHYEMNTAKDESLENHKWHFDVNYVDLVGKGIYAGDAWWGEGDEKIFVDGEEFPSFIGTGTEDYYGYAWCRPEKFSHPFIAQPTGAGNFHPGMTVNMRYRTLDAIPFSEEISSNIEMWHWVKTTINFSMTSFWYALPGFESNVEPSVESVQKPVAMKRSDIYPPVVDETGKIEGENLEIMSVGSGTAGTQSGDFGWSENSQLWWRNGEEGDELFTRFILNETGSFNVSANLTKAPDYGIVQFYLNGEAVGPEFNGYNSDGVITQEVNFGTQVLSEGENILSVKILGADEQSKPGNMTGIDWVKFQ